MSVRDLTASALVELQGEEVRPCVFLEGEFDGGVVRLWTGGGDIDWNGATWLGGRMLGISALRETSEVVASGVTVSLSGVPSELVAAAIVDARQGGAGRMWLGFLDAAGAVVADPYQIFAGRLDVPEITDAVETCTITIAYEGLLIDLTRPREFRYTPESQRLFDATDRGFNHVARLQTRSFVWGTQQ